MALTYFGGHAIADDGNVVCLGSHCLDTILSVRCEQGGLRPNINSGEQETAIVRGCVLSLWVFEGRESGDQCAKISGCRKLRNSWR